MNKIISSILITSLILFTPSVHSKTYEGIVSEQGNSGTNRIIDKATGKGVDGAKIDLPKQNFHTKTDKNGYFELDTTINGTSIMSVKKDKYKPFSITIDEKKLSAPIVVGIEKSDKYNITIDSNMHHLGDNSYSELSANAGEFRNESDGPFFTKRFIIRNIKPTHPIYLVIGSIIGIDTQLARSMGQNKNPNSFSSPPEVFFNGNKISEIQINGDEQKIKIPLSLIRKNRVNEVTIKTGRNMMQTSYVDYDDIEFMNIFIE